MGKIEDLQKIKKLLDEGLITQKEFENLKLGIIGKSDSNNNIDGAKKIYNTDTKECPNCKSLVLIKSIKCSYCNYNFILKRNPVENNFKDDSPESNVDIKPKEEEQNQLNHDEGNSNKKSFIIFGVMILFIAGIWFFNKNKHNVEEPAVDIFVDTTATVVDTISNVIPVDTSSVSVEENELEKKSKFIDINNYIGDWRTEDGTFIGISADEVSIGNSVCDASMKIKSIDGETKLFLNEISCKFVDNYEKQNGQEVGKCYVILDKLYIEITNSDLCEGARLCGGKLMSESEFEKSIE